MFPSSHFFGTQMTAAPLRMQKWNHLTLYFTYHISFLFALLQWTYLWLEQLQNSAILSVVLNVRICTSAPPKVYYPHSGPILSRFYAYWKQNRPKMSKFRLPQKPRWRRILLWIRINQQRKLAFPLNKTQAYIQNALPANDLLQSEVVQLSFSTIQNEKVLLVYMRLGSQWVRLPASIHTSCQIRKSKALSSLLAVNSGRSGWIESPTVQPPYGEVSLIFSIAVIQDNKSGCRALQVITISRCLDLPVTQVIRHTPNCRRTSQHILSPLPSCGATNSPNQSKPATDGFCSSIHTAVEPNIPFILVSHTSMATGWYPRQILLEGAI